MFNLVEALNYRCLRHVRQPMKRFHTLVGPNASGKSTFLDVVRLLSDLVRPEGLEAALHKRVPSWRDLVWMKEDRPFELAVEATIPEEKREGLEHSNWDTCRYQVRIGQNGTTEPVSILDETLLLKHHMEVRSNGQTALFPNYGRSIPETICVGKKKSSTKTVVSKRPDGNYNIYGETGAGWNHAFKMGPQRSALANLPEDESKFAASTWFKRMLVNGIDFLKLDSESMRRPSPPGKGAAFQPDGSNLPWVIRNLKEKHPEKLKQWVRHVRTSLPDVETVGTHVRDEDRHCYLQVQYKSGVEVPSWGLSDGTLRLFALTLLPYLPDVQGAFLVEEPENGIHPSAVETVHESLSSVYDAQVLAATHSPVFLSSTRPEDLLCFAQDDEGKTDGVKGTDPPRLQTWPRETDLGPLCAGGVLG
jgi:predicted ATPase